MSVRRFARIVEALAIVAVAAVAAVAAVRRVPRPGWSDGTHALAPVSSTAVVIPPPPPVVPRQQAELPFDRLAEVVGGWALVAGGAVLLTVATLGAWNYFTWLGVVIGFWAFLIAWGINGRGFPGLLVTAAFFAADWIVAVSVEAIDYYKDDDLSRQDILVYGIAFALALTPLGVGIWRRRSRVGSWRLLSVSHSLGGRLLVAAGICVLVGVEVWWAGWGHSQDNGPLSLVQWQSESSWNHGPAPRWLVPAAALALAYWLVMLVWGVPRWQAMRAIERRLELGLLASEGKDQVEIENDSRASLGQMAGSLALLVGLVFTWFQISDSRAATQRGLDTTRRGQSGDRMAKATEQLASEQVVPRVGAIYVLEGIANDSGSDYWPVMQMMATYLRQPPPLASAIPEATDAETSPPADIEAATTVLRRRHARDHPDDENEGLDLAGAQLANADLHGANLANADLSGADLTGADLDRADLSGTILTGTIFDDASLTAACFNGTDMSQAVGFDPTRFYYVYYNGDTVLPPGVPEGAFDFRRDCPFSIVSED